MAAEHYSGMYLEEGDLVFGNLKTFGFQELKSTNDNSGRFYIEDYESSVDSANEELCE